MLSYYCLKYRKNTESKNSKVAKWKKEEECFYQTVYYVIVKNQNFSNSKKLVDY